MRNCGPLVALLALSCVGVLTAEASGEEALFGGCGIGRAPDSGWNSAPEHNPCILKVQDESDDIAPAQGIGPNQLKFVITSNHPNIVDVEFYSQNRRHAWPGGNDVYSIKDYRTHSYVLNCQPGEKICFGAGVRGNYSKYWGVGIGNTQGCSSCCYTCNGTTTRNIVLEP